MVIVTKGKIIEFFFIIDEFCKEFEHQMYFSPSRHKMLRPTMSELPDINHQSKRFCVRNHKTALNVRQPKSQEKYFTIVQ